MPKFNPAEDEQLQIPNSGYHFSGVKPAILKGANEYTLVTIVRDHPGGVLGAGHSNHVLVGYSLH